MLPCIHKHWLKGYLYHDPYLDAQTKQVYDFVAAISEKRRVIATNDTVHFGENKERPIKFERENYIAVYRIEDFSWEEPHLRFRLVEKIEALL